MCPGQKTYEHMIDDNDVEVKFTNQDSTQHSREVPISNSAIKSDSYFISRGGRSYSFHSKIELALTYSLNAFPSVDIPRINFAPLAIYICLIKAIHSIASLSTIYTIKYFSLAIDDEP